VHKSTVAGFTLIELMIVVAIVAILAMIAYPSYSQYVYRTHRTDGKELLLRLAAAQEKHIAAFNTYANSITAAPISRGLGLSTATTSENGYYTIGLTTSTDGSTFTLTATPVADSPQARDVCGALSIDNALNKTYSGDQTNGKCW
jgi:type IV pilus assembly protein PilE